MSQIDHLLEAMQVYSKGFSKADLPSPPAKKVAVLTCMDSRINPWAALGVDLGDIHVIRNAGGRVTDDAIRSLVISEQMLGTNEILVMQHEHCGMMTFVNEQLQQKIAEDLGEKAADYAADIDFMPFSDLTDNVRKDCEVLRNCPLIPEHVNIVGIIYDVKTAHMQRVY